MANIEENTTLENAPQEEAGIFDGLANGFKQIVDFILYIINTMRDVITSIVKGVQ
ncbi:MAG: hypothetical protein IJO14_08305 [Clostridia bacterium]|nr:hypothetical protein [Clostridia bacterium]